MKLNIPIEVVFDDLNSMIDELGKLQKYKLGEGDDMTLVDVCDVADILMRHVKAREAKRGTHWIPCSGRLPSDEDYDETFTVTIQCEHYDGWDDYVTGYADWTSHGWDIQSYYLGQIKVVAWMPLPEPYGDESDE